MPGDERAEAAAIRTAYAIAKEKLRDEGLSVPSAADVTAELRRMTYVTTVDQTRDDCESLGLVLADARAELLRFKRARAGW